MPRQATPPTQDVSLVEPIWLRQPDEPNRWFDRFQRFLLAGANRSLLSTYNAEREGVQKSTTVPSAWYQAAANWHWRERAEAWDAVKREEAFQEYERARKQNREERLALLKAFQGKILAALRQLNPEDAKWSEVIAAIRLLVEQYRAEYDDLPTQRTEMAGTGVAIYLPQKDPIPDDV